MTNFNISGLVSKIPCKYCSEDLMKSRAIILIEMVCLNVEEFASIYKYQQERFHGASINAQE